jgi:hypothetical protein
VAVSLKALPAKPVALAPVGATFRAKLEPDPKIAPIVQRIFRECLRGKGLRAIARGLNADALASSTGKKWGTTSIEKIVHNEAYTGALVWGKRPRIDLLHCELRMLGLPWLTRPSSHRCRPSWRLGHPGLFIPGR